MRPCACIWSIVRARTVRPVQRRRIQRKDSRGKRNWKTERSNSSRAHTCRNRSLTCMSCRARARARVHITIPSSSASSNPTHHTNRRKRLGLHAGRAMARGWQPRPARLIIRRFPGKSLDCMDCWCDLPGLDWLSQTLRLTWLTANRKKFRPSW